MTLGSLGETAANIKASAAAANQASRYNRVLFKLNFMMLFRPSKAKARRKIAFPGGVCKMCARYTCLSNRARQAATIRFDWLVI